MSAPSSERRLLRPRYTCFAADRLWVIDETQPVAVLLEPTSGRIDRIVSRPENPSPSPVLTIASHEGRVWLHYRGTDVLACVTVDGVHHAEYLDQLWLLVRSMDGADRHFVRLSTDTAASELEAAIDDLDVTGYCRTVAAEPPDHASYVRYCIRRLDGRQFSKRMHDVRAEFLGDWPHGRLHISFTHNDYEGFTLVTRLSLYDEQGRRLDDVTRYVPTELMERADTRAYPGRSHAIGGVLYV